MRTRPPASVGSGWWTTRRPEYEGEYVIASEWIYRIQKNGRVELVVEIKDL
ncbi:MAG TPA: hypothetical protein VMV69_22925 [Pirellulales bacterium]|nr:hypothetical protein [Pirellulales bacterium]